MACTVTDQTMCANKWESLCQKISLNIPSQATTRVQHRLWDIVGCPPRIEWCGLCPPKMMRVWGVCRVFLPTWHSCSASKLHQSCRWACCSGQCASKRPSLFCPLQTSVRLLVHIVTIQMVVCKAQHLVLQYNSVLCVVWQLLAMAGTKSAG